jgi:DNA-binding transcriptional LysR family regulator
MENVADFGLTQLPVAEKRVQIVDIYRDEIRCVVPAGHPLWAAERVGAEDVLPYSLLLPQSGITRSRLNAWFEKVEENIQISMELDSTETMKRFVMAGLGISFLSGATAEEEVAAGLLRSIPLAPEPMVRKLGLIYRKDKALSKAALGFIQVILAHFGSHVNSASPNSSSQTSATKPETTNQLSQRPMAAAD